MTLTIQELQGLRAWFRGVGTPDLRTQDKDDIYLALDELLAFREGYDPKDRLPPDGEAVFTDCIYAPGLYPATHDSAAHVWRGETMEGEWEVPDGSPDITRWYPIPGGER